MTNRVEIEGVVTAIKLLEDGTLKFTLMSGNNTFSVVIRDKNLINKAKEKLYLFKEIYVSGSLDKKNTNSGVVIVCTCFM